MNDETKAVRGGEREQLLTDMRCEVKYTHVATMSIPLYERMKEFIHEAASQPRVTVEEVAKMLFETNPARNKALEWHHAATPKKKYRDHAHALVSAGLINVVKE